MMTPDEILRQADQQIAANKASGQSAASGDSKNDSWRDPWSKEQPAPSVLPDRGGEEPSARGFSGAARDLGVWAAKGLVSVPEAAVGLADIPTGGRVGQALENKGGSFGFRPKEWKEGINEWHTDATKAAQRKFQEAQGIGGKFQAALENPSNIAGAVVESLPSMAAGGAIGRGLMAATRLGQMGVKGAATAGAIGEGTVMAGAQAEAIRQETADGLLTPEQSAWAAGTGVAGAAISRLSGGLQNRLGIGDVDTMMAQGRKGMAKQFADEAATTAVQAANNPLALQQAAKGIPRKVIEGAITEGLLEELPQSVAEQVFQNLALGKDWHEDVDAAVVMGVLTGGAMGAGASGYRALHEPSGGGQGLPDNQAGEPAAGDALAQLERAAISAQGQVQPETVQDDGAAVAGVAQPEVASTAAPGAAPGAVPDSSATMDDVPAPVQPATIEDVAPVSAPKVSETLGLRSGPEAGPLENAAAMSVDTGATAQVQEAAAMARAAEAAKKAKPADPSKKKQEQPAQSKQAVDKETGEITGLPSMADWSGADLSTAFRNAQSKDVRLQLANELSRRRAAREEGELQAELRDEQAATDMPNAPDSAFASVQEDAGAVPKNIEIQDVQQQTQAAGPGSRAKGANVATLAQLNRKKLAEMSADELQQLSSLLPADHSRQKKIQKAIKDRANQSQSAINEGAKTNGTQTDQAQQGSTQPAQAGAAQAGQPAGKGLNNGAAQAENDGRQAGVPTAPQAQAQEPDRQQRAKRMDDAGAQWARMSFAERSALVGRLEQVSKAPFARAADLDAAQKRLEALEKDIEVNPVPPPAWLRAGAPVDSEAFRAGRPFVVTGHRWTKDGWFVLGQDAKGEMATPYNEVMDAQGMPLYEEREFQAPEVIEKESKASVQADAPAAREDMELRKHGVRGADRANAGADTIDQTETAAFKRWFGDSKVVDADGKPMVVYHGTGADFSVFDGKKRGSHTREVDARNGFFLSSSPEIASEYAEEAGANGGANIMPAYVSLQNPLVIDEGGRDYDAERFRDYIEQAQEQGHDGVLLRNTGDGMFKNGRTGDTVIAFRSEQIKSATGNNGNFDPSNQNIANFEGAAKRRPGTAQDKAVMQAIADGKGARDILRLIASASRTPFNRQVARLLLKAGITPKVELRHLGQHQGNPLHGQYSKSVDTITLAGSAEHAAERIFLHEAMHAATMRALAKPGLPKLQLQRLLEHVRKQPGAAGFYGTKNVDEFVAEVFTNPDFQNALRKMSAPAGNSLKSAWDSLVRILRSILGLSNNSNDALSQALGLGVAAVREDMGLRKRGARMPVDADIRKARILQGEPVARINTAVAPKGAPAIRAWAAKVFAQQGGMAQNPVLGAVLLDERSIRSSLAHGRPNAYKVAAFAAVKDVLERGALVLSARHGRDGESFYVSAPVQLGQTANIVTVLVKRDPNSQRMYLHSVATKEYLLNHRVSRTDTASGVERSGSDDSGDAVTVATGQAFGKASAEDVANELHRLLTMDAAGGDVANFGTDNFAALKASALDQISQTLSHPGKVSLWDKTVGTMRNLAERVPQFKPVFEAAQRFIDDVSMLANDAADFAPRLMPRVESWGDLKKKPITAADNKAVAKPLFEGTLMWARDLDGTPVTTEALNAKYRNMPADEKAQIMLRTGKLDDRVLKMWKGMPIESFEKAVNGKFDSVVLKPGVVWTQNELKTLFKLNDQQVSLYQEARGAIDRSLDMTARTDMLRAMGEQFADMREVVLGQESLKDAFTLVVDTLQDEARANPDMADRLMVINNSVVKRYETATELMDKGYAPLSRFGKYTVDVVDANGERQYFGMFESRRDSNQMKMKMLDVFKGATVTQGTMSEQAFKLFQGITPESLEMFGSMLGLKGEGSEAQDKAFQAYLQLAKNNHSALKRLIHRKGIDGYSEDVGRVLASFVYSNARLGSQGLNAGTMENAVEAIPKEMGELRDVAMGLRSYIQDPQEEGQAVRGMLFAQYLGGSAASAFVNMTQPFQITMPWLSQYGGMGQAARQMARALKDMGTKGFKYEPELAKALQSAEDDGVVSPQEIHQLMAQARGTGSLRTGDGTKLGDARAAAANNWERVKVAWGQPFALAEQFNRRSTFIASYRIAKAQGMADPAEFARKAVLETQFLYSKANKMRWGRGAVGGTLMTFKTYSVSYLELMHRMWNQGDPGSAERAAGRRAVGWAVAMLLLMGGAGGLPFMEDAEDLIDGAAQLMGYSLSTKQARKEFLSDIVGKEFAEFMEQGASGLPGAPIDVSGRLGMGNLIPGTGLFMSKQNRERDLMEIAGPAGDLVARGFTGARKALTGDFAGAALEVAPTAARNWYKGYDMATSGIYKDTKGYKVLDVTLAEAASKFLGFQPKSVAEVQEANSFMQRSKSFYQQTSAEIKAQWADALFRKDDAALARVRERLAAWNRDNPEQPIVVRMPDVWRKVREMGKDKSQRIADTAPRALRQQFREMAMEASR